MHVPAVCVDKCVKLNLVLSLLPVLPLLFSQTLEKILMGSDENPDVFSKCHEKCNEDLVLVFFSIQSNSSLT